MKWIAITGGIHNVTDRVVSDVVREVVEILSGGNGIVCGGALGVDSVVIQQALNMGADTRNLAICIPSHLAVYFEYFNTMKDESFSYADTDRLCTNIREAQKRGSVHTGESTELNKEIFFKENETIVEKADELIAFHINNTAGTEDTIQRARDRGMPVTVYTYTIQSPTTMTAKKTEQNTKKYWLVKSEESCYSIFDLEKDTQTVWSGVRNYQARNYMKEMSVGDLVLFYHSSPKTGRPAVVGISRVVGEAEPDVTAFDRKDDHFDPKSTQEKPIWYCVTLGFVSVFPQQVFLDAIKFEPTLSGIVLAQQGSRLSVAPVSESHFKKICSMGGARL